MIYSHVNCFDVVFIVRSKAVGDLSALCLADRTDNVEDDERVVPIWRRTDRHHNAPPSKTGVHIRNKILFCLCVQKEKLINFFPILLWLDVTNTDRICIVYM